MKTIARTNGKSRMGPDAYAGFLKLWLTPASRIPAQDADVDAYLRHASAREPLSAATRRILRQHTNRAA